MNLTDYSNYLRAKGYTTKSTIGIVNTAIKFLEWINEQQLEITTINYNDITAYVKHNQQRNINQRTLQLIVIQVKHYLNYLVDADIITHNPALALKIKNAKRKTVYNILSNEELETIYKSYTTEIKKHLIAPPQILNELARKRNKVLLGLLIYQGIAAEDIKNIELQHLQLREGKIAIPETKRSNERTLKLESHQIFDLYDYVNETRKQILQSTNKITKQLIVSVGTSYNTQNILQKLMKELIAKNTNLENLHQIRASVITNWLKQYNKRKVQYMAGHKYVSSTESYEASNIETLQEDLQRFYPEL
jgi:site-specific recombinase XerD